MTDAETARLAEDAARTRNWKRWGPYLAERQWGTVREDYSADGTSWDYFPHDHARSRTYRWGEHVLVRIPTANRGPDAAPLNVLPPLWFRKTWAWGRTGEGYWRKLRLARGGEGTFVAEHASLGRYRLVAEGAPELLFTENETNVARLFGAPNPSPWVKDAFHDYVVHGRADAVNPEGVGTKAACHYRLEIPAGGAVTLQLRLTADAEAAGPDPSRVFTDRIREADAFYARHIPGTLGEGEQAVVRQ